MKMSAINDNVRRKMLCLILLIAMAYKDTQTLIPFLRLWLSANDIHSTWTNANGAY